MKKEEVRGKERIKRKAISSDYLLDVSNLICSKIIESNLLASFKNVFLFFPKGKEIRLLSLFDYAKKNGIKVAFPRVTSSSSMEFVLVNSLSDFSESSFHIMEPIGKEILDGDENTLILVPALAIDKKGTRIGYGGGYYDRYLKMHPSATSMGVILENSLYNILPKEDFDIPLQFIVTEKTLYKTKV